MNIDKHFFRIKTLSYLGYFSLLLWVPMFLTSLMVFGAPGSGGRLSTWALVIGIWALPLAVFFTPRLARRALDNGRIKTAYCLVSIPPFIMAIPSLLVIVQIIFTIIWSN